ncbi:hypothetical protein OCH239_19830 [Roseivivax halodurans JCM 10272]|uniref:Phosphoesterase n=2 Tax=Roseivivax halodurans TaxID=93683 RepID=X7EIV5_9RHOB|nr:hypothetical protein OCH239_19830 [Roseivivax halodurans JCM 10272]
MEAITRRDKARALALTVEFASPDKNGDEVSPYLFSFTKGLRHSDQGIVEDPAAFTAFAAGTEAADPTVFQQAPLNQTGWKTTPPAGLGAHYRRWESPTGGHAYTLMGPDPQAIGIPAAPAAGSAELAAEMAEIYQMALCRDWPVAAFMAQDLVDKLDDPFANQCKQAVEDAASRLSQMRWFAGQPEASDVTDSELRGRRRFNEGPTPATLFRGIGEGTADGPFLSQFMVVGSSTGEGRGSGYITYGNQAISQDVRVAHPHVDYMQNWNDWLDVQNAYNARGALYQGGGGEFTDARRPMLTLRDMATYVHDDQLYQAYFNAALILLSEGAATDKGIPYHGNATRQFGGNQVPFAVFGGPHLLTLVTEASSRALRAVRAAKFTVHRRGRPELLAARFHTVLSGYDPSGQNTPYDDANPLEMDARDILASTIAPYTHPTDQAPREPALYEILSEIRQHNAKANGPHAPSSWLLPMAFPEGSPMHPAYGAGHATVAGACTTMLKAFFDMGPKGDRTLFVDPNAANADIRQAYVPVGSDAHDSGATLKALNVHGGLSIVGELNKLAWNISNSRNIAGVHYFTDYIESVLLGEAITIGILREQMCCYDPGEQVEMTVPLFVPRTIPAVLLNGPDGTQSAIQPDEIVHEIRICSDGSLAKVH